MFNLTKQERLVLLFVLGVMVCAGVLRLLILHMPGVESFFTFTERHQIVAVDVNAADQATLQKIPYIGAATARAIIAVRQQKGKFETIDDLLTVQGIGPGKLEMIRPFLKVSP